MCLTSDKLGQILISPKLRYHEVIDSVTPADKFYGRERVILKKREKVRHETMMMRRELNRMEMLETLLNGVG